jgi:anti-sigma factor RsiW
VNAASLPEELLSAYLDGECTVAETAAVEERLRVDPQWRAVLDEVREARSVLRSLPRREPAAGFVDALLTMLRPAASTSARRPRRARFAAAIAAVAAVVAGFVLATPSHDTDDVTPPVATLADSHGATSSLQDDLVSGLAPVVASTGSPP